MWLVTSVCLYIHMLLVYERVLEKMFLGYWKVLEIFLNKKAGTLVVGSNPVKYLVWWAPL